MRKVKMPIPRVEWFDDLFSMDLISKVVTSGFGDPFMCLLGVQDPLVRIGGGSTLMTMIDVYAVLGQLGLIDD